MAEISRRQKWWGSSAGGDHFRLFQFLLFFLSLSSLFNSSRSVSLTRPPLSTYGATMSQRNTNTGSPAILRGPRGYVGERDHTRASARGGAERSTRVDSAAAANPSVLPQPTTTAAQVAPMDPWQAAWQATQENMALTREVAKHLITIGELQMDTERMQDQLVALTDQMERLREENAELRRELAANKEDVPLRRRMREQSPADRAQIQTRFGRARSPERSPPRHSRGRSHSRGRYGRQDTRPTGRDRSCRPRTRSTRRSRTPRTRREYRSPSPQRPRRDHYRRSASPRRTPSQEPRQPNRRLQTSAAAQYQAGPSLVDPIAMSPSLSKRLSEATPDAGVRDEATFSGPAETALSENEELLAIQDKQYHPDEALELSGQPKSQWYIKWVTPVSMAEALDELDEDGLDEDDPVGEAHRYGISEPSEYIDPESDLPDPIIARAKDMTRRAEAAEDDRVRQAIQYDKGKARATEDPEAALSGVELGRWRYQRIESVVQAHNLRQLALFEKDYEAAEYYRTLLMVYSNAQLRRSAGIRYLWQVCSADMRSIQLMRQADPELQRPPFPPPTASDTDIVRYFSKFLARTWPGGMRNAAGVEPDQQSSTYEAPFEHDAYAAFLVRHTIPVISGSTSARVKTHAGVVKQTMARLFSIPGLYRWIVQEGQYCPGRKTTPGAYPHDSRPLTVVHIAAWLAQHGLGDRWELLPYLEQWGRRARNKAKRRPSEDTSPWPDAPRSLASCQSGPEALAIPPLKQVDWGQLVDDHADIMDTDPVLSIPGSPLELIEYDGEFELSM